MILDGNYACLSYSFSYHVMISLLLTLAELLCDNRRLFISWQNPPIPLRFVSADPGCGVSDAVGFRMACPDARESGTLTDWIWAKESRDVNI